jgi:hypothetical protein
VEEKEEDVRVVANKHKMMELEPQEETREEK